MPTGLQDDPYLKPVISQTAEIGFRFAPADKTRITAAVFHNVNKDDITFIRVAGNQAAGIFANKGNTSRDGFELTARHRESRWEAGVAYTYLKARYKSNMELPSLEGQIDVTPGTLPEP